MNEVALSQIQQVTYFECGAAQVADRLVRLSFVAKSEVGTIFEFTEKIELPASINRVPEATLDGVTRLLSFATAMSYYKVFAPVPFVVPSGLTDGEHEFISALIRHGLGEFAYQNQLPQALVPDVRGERIPSPAHPPIESQQHEPRRALVAVGGGKDSIVTIECLKLSDIEVELFAINPRTPMHETARVAKLSMQSVRRTIDPELLVLNEMGARNGHVPVTAINSLIAILAALASGQDTVVFSNEAGSSFGNVYWEGQTINHQWSKSVEFERLLREQLPEGAPEYVSLLRPINEIRIARAFASHSDYHGVFTSCNRAFRLSADESESWCGNCPKCRFIFLMLAPFLSKSDLLAIFAGGDLLLDPSQRIGFLELMGTEGLIKPFECVGEPDECRVAFAQLREHKDWQGHDIFSDSRFAGIQASQAERKTVFAWHEGAHFLTDKLEGLVREI